MADRDLPWFKCNATEFLVSCADMETETFGFYSRLILFMYSRGGRAPFDEAKLRHIWNCSQQRARKMRDALIEAGRVEVDGDYLTQARVIKELGEARRIHQKLTEKSGKSSEKVEEKSAKTGEVFSGKGLKDNDPPLPEPDTRYQIPDNTPLSPQGGETDDLVDLAGGDPKPPASDRKPDWPVPKSTAKDRPWEADEDFCKLWLHWPEPSRKNSSLTKAWGEWRKAVRRNDRAELMAALGAFLRSPDARREGGKYVKGLHLFLKEDRAASFIEAGRPVGTFERPCAVNDRGRRPDAEEDDLLAAQREYIGGWA